ncbi:HAD family phosphatase [Patescibacteria group bacterium]|nr:HAD family phosphatase [Patescibacteria group bacterium]
MRKIKNKKLIRSIRQAQDRQAQGKTKIAVFDIDGTIFRSSLLVELVNLMVEDKLFSKSIENEIEKDYHSWLNREGNYDTYINKVAEVYFKRVVGYRYKDITKVSRKVMIKQKRRVYRFTRDLVKELKGKGYYLIAISGSPVFMVKDFAKKMGFDIAFGTALEVQNGLMTDRFVARDSYNKKSKLLKKIVKDCDIIPDWKNSVAVGDSATDISMLEMVGKPIAFNPDGVLVKTAKKNGWRIVTERKNVVYDIKKFDFVHYKNQ